MRKAIRGKIRWVVLSVATMAVAVGAVPAAPAHAVTQDQCIVHVTGEDAKGNFITSPMQCYSTYAQALRSAGATVSDSVTPGTVSRATLTDSAILGTHYDGANWTGASFSVSGDLCSGGGLNLPLSWNDRITSTANGCDQIVHFNDTNYGGDWYNMTGVGGNLPSLYNNQTSSIKYYS